jgi:hypothetical protein
MLILKKQNAVVNFRQVLRDSSGMIIESLMSAIDDSCEFKSYTDED